MIDAESGILSVARGASLDPDQTDPRRTIYTLRVVALNSATDETQKAAVIVNITVRDVNNKPPVMIDPGIVAIKENIPVSI